MSVSFDKILEDSKQLPPVPLKAASAYQEKISLMTKFVDDTLSATQNINTLIGHNPKQVMFDNHRHHALFMSTVFMIGNYELLMKIVPWVYRSYSAHNFSYDYFILELKTWIKAVEKYLDVDNTNEIKEIYNWMLAKHQSMIDLSKSEDLTKAPVSIEWMERKNSFLTAILLGDHHKCIQIAKDSVKSSTDLDEFYLQVLQPVMYEVGQLWERAEISVAQEHLSSAIVTRVMATISTLEISKPQRKGKAVISSAANEYHEIGAWMISDTLENDGWDVKYLGANTPSQDLIKLLQDFKPDVLAISVTMPFNIPKLKDIITQIKDEENLNQIRIMVGGRAFNDVADLWKSTGADGFAANLDQAKQLANTWIRNA